MIDSSDDDSESSDSSWDDDDEPISGEDAGHEEAPDVVDLTDDFFTDNEAEEASDHEDEFVSWDQPKTWANDRKGHPLIAQLGEAKWRVPARRDSVPSQRTGPAQDPQFMTQV